jgi:hypothetical protein
MARNLPTLPEGFHVERTSQCSTWKPGITDPGLASSGCSLLLRAFPLRR